MPGPCAHAGGSVPLDDRFCRRRPVEVSSVLGLKLWFGVGIAAAGAYDEEGGAVMWMAWLSCGLSCSSLHVRTEGALCSLSASLRFLRFCTTALTARTGWGALWWVPQRAASRRRSRRCRRRGRCRRLARQWCRENPVRPFVLSLLCTLFILSTRWAQAFEADNRKSLFWGLDLGLDDGTAHLLYNIFT